MNLRSAFRQVRAGCAIVAGFSRSSDREARYKTSAGPVQLPSCVDDAKDVTLDIHYRAGGFAASIGQKPAAVALTRGNSDKICKVARFLPAAL